MDESIVDSIQYAYIVVGILIVIFEIADMGMYGRQVNDSQEQHKKCLVALKSKPINVDDKTQTLDKIYQSATPECIPENMFADVNGRNCSVTVSIFSLFLCIFTILFISYFSLKVCKYKLPDLTSIKSKKDLKQLPAYIVIAIFSFCLFITSCATLNYRSQDTFMQTRILPSTYISASFFEMLFVIIIAGAVNIADFTKC